MTFLKPLDALIPKIPFSFFANFWVLQGLRDSLGRILRVLSIEPFLGGGGGPAGGFYRPPPPPPANENPAYPSGGGGLADAMWTAAGPS